MTGAWFAYPYRKFFNYGEGHAAPIDWATAQVNEKLDGSLMTVYHYCGQCHVASSGLPDASGPAHVGAMSFAELFWQTWQSLAYQLPAHEDRSYMFELMTPQNRIIVHHAAPRIVLHGGARPPDLCRARSRAGRRRAGLGCVRSFPLTSFAECLSAAAGLKPIGVSEGYVRARCRVQPRQVKSPQYVALRAF